MQAALKVSGLSQRQLADKLQLGESRVSQILNGDGNVQVSTLAKVLRGMGYKIDLVVEPVDESVKPLPVRRRRAVQGSATEKASAVAGKTDRLTLARGGKYGITVRAVEFPVEDDDSEAFYMVTGRDFTKTMTSNGWNLELSVSDEPVELTERLTNA
jgi:transcriptional regulator with XRE-family HTH domain